ncbi:MAG TPA: signal peptidase I [Leptospiraceae bacterium]|nr:signal peptidase I [Leptospiraceae bacterium]HMX32870.1 signal peptidase I [Leptospiraceae bacterium]HMY31069.1 signal peptidase I [Leptospiraceae bacterium]HMZ65269.1 signal peptidase I [Leptospiraceae bacterium]HNA05872.1 signal peptidase I [Leptospiraceae bacterium]
MHNYKSKSNLSDPVEFFKKLGIRVTISVLIAFLIAYLIKFVFFFPFTVQNDFMAPEIKKDKTIYLTHLFQKDKILIGDIVLVRINENQVLLGRVMGRKGDRISIKNKKLYRNGNFIQESSDKIQFTDKRSPFASSFSKRDNLDEVLVKDKTYFLLVDNRDDGIDSRQIGLISQDSIIGKLLF